MFHRHPKACDNHAEVYDASCKESPSEPVAVRKVGWFRRFLQLSEKAAQKLEVACLAVPFTSERAHEQTHV